MFLFIPVFRGSGVLITWSIPVEWAVIICGVMGVGGWGGLSRVGASSSFPVSRIFDTRSTHVELCELSYKVDTCNGIHFQSGIGLWVVVPLLRIFPGMGALEVWFHWVFEIFAKNCFLKIFGSWVLIQS